MLASKHPSDVFRVQHLFIGSLTEASDAASDRLLSVVGMIETMPGVRRTDARVPKDARPLLLRCPCMHTRGMSCITMPADKLNRVHAAPHLLLLSYSTLCYGVT